jgi:pteridine reductase
MTTAAADEEPAPPPASRAPRFGSGPPPPLLERPRRVLVVGATGLLGVAISRGLARRGDRVALTARDPRKLDDLADDLAKLAPALERPRVITADLRDHDAPDHIAAELLRSGGLDDVVLACGPFPRTPLDKLRREDLEGTLTVHAIAPLLLVNALAEELGRRNGAVVALADAGVTRPYENHVAYLTAKGALQTGLRALAVELAPHVRVNLVALGIVSDPEADADPLRTHRLATRSPLGRFGTPAEVVQTVLALLDATWATGEIWGVGR